MNAELTNDDSKSLGIAAIAAIFARNGYSQSQFAEDYGVHRSAVSQFFSGKTTSAPMLAAARTIASYFLAREAGKRS